MSALAPVGAEADSARLAAEQACLAVITAYADRVDAGHAAQVTELFTDDGSFSSGLHSMTGRAELAAAFEARQANTSRQTRHLVLNPTFRVIVDGAIEAHSSMLLFVLDPDAGNGEPVTPNMLLNCEDRLERGDDGCWRISSRRLVRLAGGS